MKEKIALEILKEGYLTIPNIILKNYQKLGMNEEEFVLLLQIQSILESGYQTLNFDKIASLMGKDSAQIYKMIHSLLEKKLLCLTPATNEKGINYDQYSLDPLYKKIIGLKDQEEKTVETSRSSSSLTTKQTIFQKMEEEFGRPLTPIEIETVNDWLEQDHYSPQIIILALKEAVLSNVYNLKYIDKILLTWEKKGIKTASDVEREREKRRGKVKTKIGNKNKPKIPLIKWSQNNPK